VCLTCGFRGKQFCVSLRALVEIALWLPRYSTERAIALLQWWQIMWDYVADRQKRIKFNFALWCQSSTSIFISSSFAEEENISITMVYSNNL
jgi:hypothetical protein